MRLKALLDRRAKLTAEAKAIFDLAAKENRDLTQTEKDRDDAIEAELATVNAEIDREQRQQQRDLAVSSQRIATTGTGTGASGQAIQQPQRDQHGRVIVGQSGDERRMQDPMLGWRDVGEFAIAVQTACRPGGAVDPRLATPVPQPGAAPTDFHRETGSTDGYMVPPQARQEIYQIAFNDPLLDLITREPTTSNSVDLLADETTPWGATGVQARWRSEGTQMTPSRLVTDPRRVIAHELYAFVLATGELLQDAPRLASRLTLRAGQAIRWKLGAAFMRGTGAGQPLGWLNAGALVTQAATDNGSPAVNLTALNVAEMYSRMLADFIGQAVWVANTDVLPSLITLRLGENTIWTPPATGIAQAPGGFIVGRPLMFSEHCATVGSVGDLQFIAPAGYYATQRGELESASSLHLFFDYNVEAFRWIIRVGGMPFLSAPVSPAYGSSTKSHFVALAAR